MSNRQITMHEWTLSSSRRIEKVFKWCLHNKVKHSQRRNGCNPVAPLFFVWKHPFVVFRTEIKFQLFIAFFCCGQLQCWWKTVGTDRNGNFETCGWNFLVWFSRIHLGAKRKWAEAFWGNYLLLRTC